MAYIQDGCLVVGISARALFDMDLENNIFEKEGLEAYRAYQIAHEEEVLRPGPCFSLIRSLLEIDRPLRGKKRVEVILMSHNDADVSLRLFRSIEHYGLSVARAVFSGGVLWFPICRLSVRICFYPRMRRKSVGPWSAGSPEASYARIRLRTMGRRRSRGRSASPSTGMRFSFRMRRRRFSGSRDWRLLRRAREGGLAVR